MTVVALSSSVRLFIYFFFFLRQTTAYEMRSSDWSADVCSSDLPVFRDQVNLYVHDFEAVIRRVISERDGGPMAVAMLSSDVGKLYVALAQAIERLRSA